MQLKIQTTVDLLSVVTKKNCEVRLCFVSLNFRRTAVQMSEYHRKLKSGDECGLFCGIIQLLRVKCYLSISNC